MEVVAAPAVAHAAAPAVGRVVPRAAARVVVAATAAAAEACGLRPRCAAAGREEAAWHMLNAHAPF